MKFRFRAGAKVCSGAIMVLLVVLALGPANWTPRTPLGWQIDHFLGYSAITLFVCVAWPRPLVVGEFSWPIPVHNTPQAPAKPLPEPLHHSPPTSAPTPSRPEPAPACAAASLAGYVTADVIQNAIDHTPASRPPNPPRPRRSDRGGLGQRPKSESLGTSRSDLASSSMLTSRKVTTLAFLTKRAER